MQSISKLLNLANDFYKNASILRVPQELLKEVQEWVVGNIIDKIIKDIDDKIYYLSEGDKDEKSLRLLKAKLNKEFILNDSSSIFGKIFTLSSDQVSYTSEIDNKSKVRFSVVMNYVKKGKAGQWIGRDISPSDKEPIIGQITIYYYIPEYAEIYEYIERVKRTVRHEMQHLVQAAITYFKQLKNIAGLPSHRIRNLDIHPSGYDSSTGRLVEHSFRDVEFYSRISDAVDLFNQLKKYIPTNLHKKLADVIMAKKGTASLLEELRRLPNLNKDQLKLIDLVMYRLHNDSPVNFFNKLKFENDSYVRYKNEIEEEQNSNFKARKSKWQKAVKEFAKAINYIE